MKKLISIITVLIIFNPLLHAQKAMTVSGKKVKDGVVYLQFDGKNLEYFTPDKTADSKKNINESITFSLKDDNSCNIYLKWVNPLKYRLSWKDSTYVDERDKAVGDFIGILVNQFGTAVTTLNKSESKGLITRAVAPALATGLTPLIIPDGFNNPELTLVYLQLRINQNNLTDADRIKINSVTQSIIDLDTKMVADIPKEVNNKFSELFELNDPTNLTNILVEKESDIKKHEAYYAEIETLVKDITKSISEQTLSDNLLNSYFKTTVIKFIDQSKVTISANKNLTNKLKPIVEMLKNSIKDESSSTSTKGFYKIRSVEFEDGKKLQTSLTVTEFEYKSETKELIKKTESPKKSLIFQRYDFFAISVSTGLFYANTTLKGFGVDNQLKVTEDEINKSSPVTAIFLNFNFGFGSRYLAPLLQIGVDPTKKRPFLLLGGGFSIPSASIAITGGPTWVWNQSLDKLTVGQTISSTTDLEKDILYKFDVKPRGWYLGIQYNF
jgi:hypothetical protein